MRWIIAASFVLTAAGAVAQTAQPWSVASPDGRTTIAVVRQADGRLVWRAARETQPILADSPREIVTGEHL